MEMDPSKQLELAKEQRESFQRKFHAARGGNFFSAPAPVMGVDLLVAAHVEGQTCSDDVGDDLSCGSDDTVKRGNLDNSKDGRDSHDMKLKDVRNKIAPCLSQIYNPLLGTNSLACTSSSACKKTSKMEGEAKDESSANEKEEGLKGEKGTAPSTTQIIGAHFLTDAVTLTEIALSIEMSYSSDDNTASDDSSCSEDSTSSDDSIFEASELEQEPTLAMSPVKLSEAENNYMPSKGRSLSSEALNLMRRIIVPSQAKAPPSDVSTSETSDREPTLTLPPGKVSEAEEKHMSSIGRSLSGKSLNLIRRIIAPSQAKSPPSDVSTSGTSEREPTLTLPPGQVSEAEEKHMSSKGRSLSGTSLNLLHRIKGTRRKKTKAPSSDVSAKEDTGPRPTLGLPPGKMSKAEKK